jgi:hypothetical protein
MLSVLLTVTALTAAMPSFARAMHAPGDNGAPQQPQVTVRAGHSTAAYLPMAAGLVGGAVLLGAGAALVVAVRRDRRASHPPALYGQSR